MLTLNRPSGQGLAPQPTVTATDLINKYASLPPVEAVEGVPPVTPSLADPQPAQPTLDSPAKPVPQGDPVKSFDISDLLKKYTPTAQDQAQGQDAAPEAPVDTLPSTPASIIPDTVPALPIEGEGSSDGANTLDAYVADFANFFADKEFIKEVFKSKQRESK